MTIRLQVGGWPGEDRATRRRLLSGMIPTADCLIATNHRTTHRARAMGRAYCARKTTLPTRSFPILARGQFGELYYLGQGFLTVAHVVSKRLLVVHELKSKVGVPSEPCTELIPSFFGIELCAILIVRAICHLRSEGISIVAVVAQGLWSASGGETAGAILCGPWQHAARRSATEPRQHFLLRCSLAQNCRAPLLIGYNLCRTVHIPWQRCSWVQPSCPRPPWPLQCQFLVVQQAPLARGEQA